MCVEGTFESKSGNAPSIEVAKSDSHGFSTLATLNSGHKVIDIAHCDMRHRDGDDNSNNSRF